MAVLRIAKANPFKILRKFLKAFSQKNAPCNGIESIYEVNFETNEIRVVLKIIHYLSPGMHHSFSSTWCANALRRKEVHVGIRKN